MRLLIAHNAVPYVANFDDKGLVGGGYLSVLTWADKKIESLVSAESIAMAKLQDFRYYCDVANFAAGGVQILRSDLD